jgi:hypothetical protein
MWTEELNQSGHHKKGRGVTFQSYKRDTTLIAHHEQSLAKSKPVKMASNPSDKGLIWIQNGGDDRVLVLFL